MHAYGAALDISAKYSNYWRWALKGRGELKWQNQIPIEIVNIFERHGFIWGGRWYHYDTMHFEYRPELLGSE
jgi:D-alanyl-D-alanine carboxypeptidase